MKKMYLNHTSTLRFPICLLSEPSHDCFQISCLLLKNNPLSSISVYLCMSVEIFSGAWTSYHGTNDSKKTKKKKKKKKNQTHLKQQTNQPTSNQSTNQLQTNQQPTNQPTNQPINQPTSNQSTTNQPDKKNGSGGIAQ